jgi:hypothetical protein
VRATTLEPLYLMAAVRIPFALTDLPELFSEVLSGSTYAPLNVSGWFSKLEPSSLQSQRN